MLFTRERAAFRTAKEKNLKNHSWYPRTGSLVAHLENAQENQL